MKKFFLFPFEKFKRYQELRRDIDLIRDSVFFDGGWYLARYPDIAKKRLDPARHYLQIGWIEGRDPGPDFSSSLYLDVRDDVKKARINPLLHYLKYGQEDGHVFPMEQAKDGLSLIKSSGLFDGDWYLANNPDVGYGNPLVHYYRIGGLEDRDPGPDFHVAWYLDTYGDVRVPGEHAISYYLKYGRLEGYDTKPQEITEAVKSSLTSLLNRLGISSSADEIIFALSGYSEFGNYIKTRLVLKNLVEVETFLSTPKNREMRPLIRASQLPEVPPTTGGKNILFITSEFPSRYSGGGNRVLNFIEALSKDNDIYLCTAFKHADDEIGLPVLEKYCRSILKVPYINYGGNQEEILAWLHGVQMDIVHYEWVFSLKNYSPDFGRHQIFTYMESACLRTLMDMERLEPLSNVWMNKFEQLSNALLFEFVLAAPLQMRVVVTTKDGEFSKKIFPFQEYTVLNHGLNFEEFAMADVRPEPYTLVFVGNYVHYPNADAMRFFFNKIWQDVRAEVPDVRIYVVGTTPPDDLLQMANGKSIIVTGEVPDVRSYIQKASVCIAPLISGAGLRGKVIEYAALKRAFVATSIATTDLGFKDGVDYFCADQPAEFSQKVVQLLKDPELAGQMADRAYHTARENYDTKRLTGQLLSLYQYLERQSNVG